MSGESGARRSGARHPGVGRFGLLLVGVMAAMLVLAGCGGDPVPPEPPPEGVPGTPESEEAWLRVVAELGLEPDRDAVAISGMRAGDELLLTIALPAGAGGEAAFGDGLYGAQAYAVVGGAWERVDAAEIRTLIAPVLKPGESASVPLPVLDADSYRVLVPVGGLAAWADVS